MPTFVYQGRNSQGVLMTGKRLSQSADALGAQLIKEGVIPVSITVEEDEKNSWAYFKKRYFHKKVSPVDLAIFCKQMYTLTKAGVSITLGIRQLAESTGHPQLAAALFGVVEQLESGQDLAGAMQNYPEEFPILIVSMIRVGQNTGRLDDIFLNLYHFYELEVDSIKRTKAILRYPIFVMATIIIAITTVNFFVIPAFANAYSAASLKLPWITELLIGISLFTKRYWLLVFILFMIAVFGVRYYLKTSSGKIKWDRAQLRIPILGHLIKRVILLRFIQAFAVVVNSGVPLVEGIGLVAQSIQNTYIHSRILLMQDEIQRGKSLTQSAITANIFTPLELQMLSISEETGSLGGMLEQIAEYYQRDLDYDLKRLTDIIEPILLIGLSLLILGLALAVYLPIWNMIKMVHR